MCRPRIALTCDLPPLARGFLFWEGQRPCEASLSRADDSNCPKSVGGQEPISQMLVGESRGGGKPRRICKTLCGPAGCASRGHFLGVWAVCRVDGAFAVTSRGDEYRRRARTCFDAAHATENEQTRAALLRLAEDWQ